MGIFSGALSLGAGLLNGFLAHTSAYDTNIKNQENVNATNAANIAISDRANYWNREIARETNQMNEAIANQNLGFQRELQEYQKSLQQQQWEREDTSYQRTAADMLKAGLNPLDMQGTNGAGEVVSMSPLENTMVAQQPAAANVPHLESFKQADAFNSALQSMSGISTIAESINQIETGNLQRDSLALDNNRKWLENSIMARKYGIDSGPNPLQTKGVISYIGGSPWDLLYGNEAQKEIEEYNKSYIERLNAEREYNHKSKVGIYDTDTDFERLLTAIQDWISNGRGEESWKKLQETFPILRAFK